MDLKHSETEVSNIPMRRTGDAIKIGGDYQFNALEHGFVVQRFWHSRKLKTIDRLCRPQRTMRVLDVGCGSGVVSNYLAQFAREVHAIDSNPEAIAFASKQFKRENLFFHHSLADGLPFDEASFDAIYSFEVIEHIYVEQVREMLKQWRRLLTPGGKIIITTPNYHSAWPLIEFFLDRSGLVPQMQEHQHVWKPTRARLRELATDAQVTPVQIGRGFGLAPFASILGWEFAERLDALEHRVGAPFGNLLCAVFCAE